MIYSRHALGRINGVRLIRCVQTSLLSARHHHLKAQHRQSHLKSGVNPWLAVFNLLIDKMMDDADDWLFEKSFWGSKASVEFKLY